MRKSSSLRYLGPSLAGLLMFALPAAAWACSGRAHIEVMQSGVYALDHAALVAAQPGLADCAADDLVLQHRDGEVPIRVVGAADGRFGPGSRIEWVGHQLHGPESWNDAYSINNVYLLGAAPGPHKRIADAAPAGGKAGLAGLQRTLHLEQDNLMIRLDMSQQQPGQEPDVWQWAKLTHVDPQPFTTSFDLPDLAARGPDVALTLNFRGLSTLFAPNNLKGSKPADHHVELRVNGRLLTALEWDKRDEVRKDVKVPLGLLEERGNTLEMRIPKRPVPWQPQNDVVDVVMFNWAEVRYPIAGDLDAGVFALAVRDQPAADQELRFQGAGAPVLFGDDGVRRPGEVLADGRYRFAPAPVDVDQYPALDGQLAAPVRVRAAADGTDWRAPAHGYDYLIVSHASLMDAVRPLAEFHRQRGLKVAMIDPQEAYDQFNGGISHPQAIRNLVDTAWNEWPEPRPRFLLLVGKASFDIRHDTYDDGRYAKWTNMELLYPNQFGGIASTSNPNRTEKLADSNLIPTWQFPSPEGQSASDNGFVTVGREKLPRGEQEWKPVLAVGRFPVVKPEEVTAIVNKTINYMTNPPVGRWRREAMMITDDSEYFHTLSDDLANSLDEQGFATSRIYAHKEEEHNVAHQSAIRDGLNEGQLLVHFIGHGGRYIWRTGAPDVRKNHDLFTLDDVSNLSNGGRLPVILSMTCYSAPFDNPSEDSIGERFLREADRGAVAVFAASWRNSPSPAFSKALMTEILEPGQTIGEGIVKAKNAINNRILVEMYNLLGDPALVMELPRDPLHIARDGDRWSRDLLVALPMQRFNGEVVVDWVDATGKKQTTRTYRTDQPRFRLPIPRLPDGEPAKLRAYAYDLVTGKDALGTFVLHAPPVEPAEPAAAAKSAVPATPATAAPAKAAAAPAH
ncbi:C25 family cysteine peptidase [Dokdonella koreensis]|nr:C25 family cysteine peptidase [Dokdonella koreensis]